MDTVIESRQLSLRLRHGMPWARWSQTVLDEVSFSVPAGAVVGLLGRNGAGKSSLMRCLAGLQAPTSGGSTLLGCDSARLSDAVRQQLGYAGQEPDLMPHWTGREHLQQFGACYAGFDAARIEALATAMDCPLGRRAGSLSLGNQQKLSLLLALAPQPRLMLLDEPMAALDPLARRTLLRALFDADEAPQGQRTVLLSSHLLEDLERVATHLLLLRQGRVALWGAWDELAESLCALPAAQPLQGEGALHWSRLREQQIVDRRRWRGTLMGAQALGLADLFEAMHT